MVAGVSGPAHNTAPGGGGVSAAGKNGRCGLREGGDRRNGNATSEACWRINEVHCCPHSLGNEG